MPALTQADYVALADACQRAGRARVESHAHFKAAELMITERASRPQAAGHLVQYLNLSRRLEDLPGEAKALNALGVLYYQLALDNAENPGGADGRAVVDLLERSLQYHRQHAAIADAAGVFIANTNAGLVYERLGDATAAVEAHKLALTFAVQAGDKNAESVALANVAAAGTTTGDAATTRLCGQRQLELGDTLRSGAVSCEAHEQLGQLALQRGDFAGASTHLTAAFETAAAEGDPAKSQRLRCLLGVVQSAARVDERMRTQAAAMMGVR
jgi:tetratricopeptide (TPR) repeat protein